MAMRDVQAIQKFVEILPLCQAMGIYVSSANEFEIILPYQETIIGDPHTGVIHGGAISTLLDTACGALVFTHPENTGSTATIDLRIDYMRPAKPGYDVKAKGEVFQTTRHVAFVKAWAFDDHHEQPIAMAAATFTFSKQVKK